MADQALGVSLSHLVELLRLFHHDLAYTLQPRVIRKMRNAKRKIYSEFPGNYDEKNVKLLDSGISPE